ncbi:MarR family winged helix-turn-helix transcriptional regulator [Paracoccus aurantiacus]|uniref:MarR family winged helix-turn-helix transcriptional regulator n=1 Tax=Paracoccus aurantiacus TaxID=2599412 RepID=UPI00164A8D9E|nr:MarR family transcriptional regulator [Paracoccus aurantiacus]
MPEDRTTATQNDEDGFLSATALDQSLGYKLRLAQILAYRSFEEQMTDYGVAPRYLGLLGIVAENPGQAQNRLADSIGLQKSSLVTILDRLEKDGILERRASAQDRRAKTVWLTNKGEQVVAELFLHARDHEARMAAGIDDHLLADVVAALDVMIANLRGLSD